MTIITTTYDDADWQIVPKVPTSAMANAGANVDPERESPWDAYLSAAPTLPSVQEPITQSIEFDRLLTVFGNLQFDIGEWEQDDENDLSQFNTLLEKARVARAAIHAFAVSPSVQVLPDIVPYEQMLPTNALYGSDSHLMVVLRELTEYRALLAQLKGVTK